MIAGGGTENYSDFGRQFYFGLREGAEVQNGSSDFNFFTGQSGRAAEHKQSSRAAEQQSISRAAERQSSRAAERRQNSRAEAERQSGGRAAERRHSRS